MEKKLKFAKVLKYIYEMSFAQCIFLIIRLTYSCITYSEYQVLNWVLIDENMTSAKNIFGFKSAHFLILIKNGTRPKKKRKFLRKTDLPFFRFRCDSILHSFQTRVAIINATVRRRARILSPRNPYAAPTWSPTTASASSSGSHVSRTTGSPTTWPSYSMATAKNPRP